jgi:general stress protein 26
MQPTATRVEEFSEPNAPEVMWSHAESILATAEMFWLSTVRTDGRPHVVPLPAVWHDGQLHFCTGGHEQKARNLEANPRCALTTGANTYRAGTDLVVEGKARIVRNVAMLTLLAAKWGEKYQWDFGVGDGVFLDTDSGNSPVVVFGIPPEKVLLFTKKPYSQTRFSFPQAGG